MPSRRSSACGCEPRPRAWRSPPANKMRRGLKVKLSYSGDIPETVIFDLA